MSTSKEIKGLVENQYSIFEQHTHFDDGVEFWFARDLSSMLGYREWRNFLPAIERAKQSCSNSGQQINDHFVEFHEMVELGSGAKRDRLNIKLTRYASYLIAQNGDPKKPRIAFAQTYFALQTRKMETIQQRLRDIERVEAREKLTDNEKRLSAVVFERGIKEQGFGRFKTAGDKALFGGYNNKEMKKKLGVPDKKPLADYLPTVSIKAKDLANEITRVNVENKDLRGERDLISENINSNSSVRKALTERGIKPEDLPPSEDIKKIERRIKKEEKLGFKVDAKIPK